MFLQDNTFFWQMKIYFRRNKKETNSFFYISLKIEIFLYFHLSKSVKYINSTQNRCLRNKSNSACKEKRMQNIDSKIFNSVGNII